MVRRYVIAVVAALAAFAAVLSIINLVSGDPRRVQLKTDQSIVVIAAPGLRWADITSATYPDLWSTLDYGAIGSLSPRGGQTGTCSTQAWLSLSAGRGVNTGDALCTKPPKPTASGGTAQWPQWAGWRKDSPELGLVADRYRAAGKCVAAVGPGAALAAADRDGKVGTYAATAQDLKPGRCALTFVDASGGSAKTTMSQLNTAFSQVPPSATVIITGLSDGPGSKNSGDARLRMLFTLGNSVKHGTLWSASVRQPGVTQLPDLTATLLAPLGEVPSQVQGSPLQIAANKTHSGSLVSAQRSLDNTLRASYDLSVFFFIGWESIGILLGILLWRKRTRVPPPLPPIITAWSAIPIATFLASWAPWANWPAAPVWLVVFTVLFAAVLTGIAYAGPWRRTVVGPVIAVAIITWVVLALDVMTGSRLQFASLLGLQPLNGGRFYGMGNVGFALFATSAFVAAGLAAGLFLDRALARLAALTIGLATLATVVIDGWPGWGADFGGPPAVVVAGAVLIVFALGIRWRAKTVLLVAAGAVAVALLLALADWLRPASSRTHLGRFVQDVLDGNGAGVVGEKLVANLKLIVETPANPLVLIAFVALVVLIARPQTAGGQQLATGLGHIRFARETLIGLLVLWGVGFAINDSGLALLLNGLGLSAALAFATTARYLRDEQDDVIRI